MSNEHEHEHPSEPEPETATETENNGDYLHPELTDAHPRELEAPPRTYEEEVFAHVFANLTMRTLVIAFAAGAIIGLVAGQWMVNSIAINTSGLSDPAFVLALTLMGAVGMVGVEFCASLTAAYFKMWYGLRVNQPL